MLSRPLIAIALALALACSACGEPAEVLVAEGLLVLKGATLIDGTGAEPREDSVVVVDGGRIVRVGSTGQEAADCPFLLLSKTNPRVNVVA